jgi:hypothetical protein
MPVWTHLLRTLTLALLVTPPVACAQAGDAPSSGATSLVFGGVTYVHRWSQGGQHEFTPEGDGDLDSWTDMVTINVHEAVRDGDQLAETANGVLANYQGAGEIIRTDSKPRTETAPAEHFIAAVLGSPTFLEAAFARLMLVEGTGVVVVYSHRVYGQSVGPAMSEWLGERGQQVEETLMSWSDVPSVLRALSEGD